MLLCATSRLHFFQVIHIRSYYYVYEEQLFGSGLMNRLPPLDPYIAPAVEELKAWHSVVMQAVRKSQT